MIYKVNILGKDRDNTFFINRISKGIVYCVTNFIEGVEDDNFPIEEYKDRDKLLTDIFV